MAELHRANLERLESQIAAEASDAAVELERLREAAAAERQQQQHVLTVAKEETARARREALRAREDALHWQQRAAA
eukprot:6186656-Pleurochrysis_carterae.AAC.1